MEDQTRLLPERLDPVPPLPLVHLFPLEVQSVLHFEAAAEVWELSGEEVPSPEPDRLLFFSDLFSLCLDLLEFGPRHDQLLAHVGLLTV